MLERKPKVYQIFDSIREKNQIRFNWIINQYSKEFIIQCKDFDKYRENILHSAAIANSIFVVSYVVNNLPLSYIIELFSQKDDTGATPLHLASPKFLMETSLVLNSHSETRHVFKRLLDLRDNLGTTVLERLGPTLLNLASSCGEIETLNFLIEIGAQVNSCDEKGITPLYSAISNNKIEVVKMLLKNGANPNLFHFKKTIN
jgi:ankyrin repeat protein